MVDPVSIAFAPASDLVALDLWDGSPPNFCEVRALQVEPLRWWLADAGDRIEAIAATIGERGALTPFGGGMVCATLSGRGWRDLLSISSLFDTGDPAFGPGPVASTIIHHVPVRITVVSNDVCEVYFAASFAATLEDLWRTATRGETNR